MKIESEIIIEFSEEQRTRIARKCGFVPKPIVTNSLSLTMLSLAATAKKSYILPLVNRLSICHKILESGTDGSNPQFYTLTLELSDEQRETIKNVVNKDWYRVVIVPDDYEIRYQEFWQSEPAVHRIGQSFVVVSEKSEYLASENDILIQLPEFNKNNTSFGTGNHPTTQIILCLLEKYLKPNYKVLDFGTGSGILAIAAAKLGAENVLAVDVDSAAIETAKKMAELNNVCDKIQTETGGIEVVGKTFDLVTANLFPNIILALADSLSAKVVSGGILLLSGLVSERIEEIDRLMQNVGFEHLESSIIDFWGGIAFRKK